jgi:tetratricopeptide (TPR) repeat protein
LIQCYYFQVKSARHLLLAHLFVYHRHTGIDVSNTPLTHFRQHTTPTTAAHTQEAEGDFAAAVSLWQQSLEAARAAGDRSAEGRVTYRLGRAWVELQEPLRALNHLEDCEAIATELDDLEGQGAAFAALAAAYQALGNDVKVRVRVRWWPAE